MKHTTTPTATTTRRTRALLAVSAALLLLPGALTACSADAPTGDESKRPGAGAGATTASCMRDKGYDMPDPSADGGMKMAIPDGVDQDQYSADLDSCMGTTGSGGAGAPAKPAPGMEAKSAQVAKCIRDAGFSDYPDGMDARSKYRADDEDAFGAAAQKCSEEAFGDGATGAGR